MQSRRMVSVIVCTLALSSPAAFAAEPEIFEVMDQGAEAIGYCQTLHRTADCSTFHVQGLTVSPTGTVLDLEGKPYRVDWTGPGYYLESGVVLQPLGEAKAGLGGQRWLEVLPEQGRIHTSSSWKDLDANRALSVSDTLTLVEGKERRTLKIKDVRLHVRATPLSGDPERPGRPAKPEQQ